MDRGIHNEHVKSSLEEKFHIVSYLIIRFLGRRQYGYFGFSRKNCTDYILCPEWCKSCNSTEKRKNPM